MGKPEVAQDGMESDNHPDRELLDTFDFDHVTLEARGPCLDTVFK